MFANPHTILSLGDLKNPVAYMTILGIFIILVLLALEVKGAIFIGMAVVAIYFIFHRNVGSRKSVWYSSHGFKLTI